MGFTQVNNETVMDDEGNLFYAPSMPAMGAPGADSPSPGPAPENPYPAQPENPYPTPQPYAGPGPAAGPPTQPNTPEDPYGQVPAGQVTAGQVPAPLTPKVLSPTQAKVAQGQARTGAIGNDLTAFSAAGGTLETDPDLARAAGGMGEQKAQTAVEEQRLATQNQALQAEKLRTMAEATIKVVSEHEQRVQAAYKSASDDLASWNKKNDEAMKAVVDPNRAFTNMSTASKALWALQFLGAGLGGGDQVHKVSETLNQIVDQDIGAQKANITNLREGLGQQRLAIDTKYKLGQDALTSWASDKTVKLSSLGQIVDAKIAEMGQAQAARVGLLKARDAINQEVFKVQNDIATHFQKRAETQANHSFEYGKLRLEHEYKMLEQTHEAKLKKEGEQDTLPMGTGLGLQMVDNTTGQIVPGGQIKLRPGMKAPEVVKAGQIVADANDRASALVDIKEQLQGMSTGDIVRGGSPEFRQKLMSYEKDAAIKVGGKTLTDSEARLAAEADFGFDLSGHAGLTTQMFNAAKVTGDVKTGVLSAIENNLRNVSSNTMSQLGPYIDSTDAQRYTLAYNPQQTRVKAPSTEAPDVNTAVTQAGGGADVKDLQVPGARAPVKADTSLTPEQQSAYPSEKAKGRGVQGGLPRLAPDEEVKVQDAVKSFDGRGSDDILRLSQSYLRNPALSPEAKHEIRLETQEHLKEVMPKELELQEDAKDKFKALHDLLKLGKLDKVTIEGKDYTDLGAARADTVEYNPVFQKFLHSDLVDEMRTRAGLPALKR